MPAPPGKAPGFGEELARLCATPEEPVRASLRRVFGAGPWPDSATDLLERPRESLEQIAAELTDCHDRLIVPHWERIRSVLDADVAYHAGLLAGGGARALFSDLHPGLRWSAGRLLLSDAETGPDEITLGPDGVVLMPSVFIWPEWSVKRATSTQTTLVYPARGAATVWESGLDAGGPGPGDPRAVESLLGAPRARLLGALRSPATTTALAAGSASRRARSRSTWRSCAAAGWSTGSAAGGPCSTRPPSSGSPCWRRGAAREGGGLLRVRGYPGADRGPRAGLSRRRGGHRGGGDWRVPVGLARLEGPRPGRAAAHRRARVRWGGHPGRSRGDPVARRGPGDGAVRLRLRHVRVLHGRRGPGVPAADPAWIHRAGVVRRARGRPRGGREPGGAARRRRLRHRGLPGMPVRHRVPRGDRARPGAARGLAGRARLRRGRAIRGDDRRGPRRARGGRGRVRRRAGAGPRLGRGRGHGGQGRTWAP